MRVGSVSSGGASARLYGTSHLWHDPDYTLERANPYFRVQQALDSTLPFQEHVEPAKAQDPYLAQEKGYDLAFKQMTKGIEGRDFLHGVKDPNAFSSAAQTQAVLQNQAVVQGQRGQEAIAPGAAASARAVQDQTQTYVAPPPGVKPKSATNTAADAERAAMKAPPENNQVSEVLSMIGGAVTTAATAAAQAQILQTMGAGAAQTAGAIQGVASTAATASGQAINAHDKSQAEEAAKAGRLARAFSKQPSAEPTETEIPPVDPTKAAPDE